MEQILSTNNRGGNSIFYSRENLDTELGTFLRKTDPLLYDMFENSKILSEIIIYTFKEMKKIRKFGIIRIELEKYFTDDTMRLKGFSAILNLSLINVFHRAFTQLAWWRQLLLKFTGKYTSYEEQYTRQSYKGAESLSPQKPGDTEGIILPDPVNSSSAGLLMPAKQKKKGPQNIQKKAYSKKQQEHAWNEFSKTIRPK
jgi:hypothetical protein